VFILVSEYPEVAEWKLERAERAQRRQYWDVGQACANRVTNEISDGCVVPSWPSENKLEMSSGAGRGWWTQIGGVPDAVPKNIACLSVVRRCGPESTASLRRAIEDRSVGQTSILLMALNGVMWRMPAGLSYFLDSTSLALQCACTSTTRMPWHFKKWTY